MRPHLVVRTDKRGRCASSLFPSPQKLAEMARKAETTIVPFLPVDYWPASDSGPLETSSSSTSAAAKSTMLS